jgi:MFS family permease
MSTLPNLINSVFNPIVSFKSDRYRSRWGRRIPFIVMTLPFLVLSIIGLGFTDPLSRWISRDFGGALHMPVVSVDIITIGVFMVCFSFFNSFVGAVFWYLFNDVVPEHLLARFMSLFRLVSLATAAGYQFFLFQYAGTHSTEILVGISLLYFFGFGLMCLMVKEGQYPPAPAYVDGRTNPLSAIKTFAKECLTLPHYWYVFLISIFGALTGAAAVFMLYFYESTGMSLAQVGRLTGTLSIAVAVLIPVSGWLADRFHPLRIVIAGYVVNLAVTLPATLIWLAWHPASHVAFWVWMGISIALIAPATALLGVYDPPVFMVIFPRSRYGQYCSANAMLRSLGGILGGVIAGAFFDFAAHHVKHEDIYRLMPIWQILFTIPAFVCVLLLYRSWKRYGGDAHYVPPVPGETLARRLSEELSEEEVPAETVPLATP